MTYEELLAIAKSWHNGFDCPGGGSYINTHALLVFYWMHEHRPNGGEA